jgi:ATP-dependent DNA ligase
MFKHACGIGLEGVVSKVRDSRYPSGRSNDWGKKTCAQRETLNIAGFALDGSKWDGLYLARRKGDDLIYSHRASGLRTGSKRCIDQALSEWFRTPSSQTNLTVGIDQVLCAPLLPSFQL